MRKSQRRIAATARGAARPVYGEFVYLIVYRAQIALICKVFRRCQMNERLFAAGLIAAAVSIAACSNDASMGSGSAASSYDHPMTEWGDPDLRGTWPIQHLIVDRMNAHGRIVVRRAGALHG